MKRAHGLLVLSTFLILFLARHPPALAQDGERWSCFLKGRVTAPDGVPVPGVTVALSGLGTSRVETTDDEGRFEFRGLEAGVYELTLQRGGFATASYPQVSVGPDLREEISLVLEEELLELSLPDDAPPTMAPPPPAPPPPAGGPAAEPAPVSPPDRKKGYVELEVFYGTDRFATGSKVPEQYFSGERSGATSLHLGVCRVSIPPGHRRGEIEEPSIWRFEFQPDPNKHMVLLGRESLSQKAFYKRMQSTLQRSRKKEVMVFVHGFNVAFKDAALRTAQLAYDLRIDGAPVLYSWPSQASLAKYKIDETNAEWTIPHLESFLWDLSRQSGAGSIYLIAHSMGNRPLTRALERIAARLTTPGAKPPFSEILLTAPDIDAEVFADLARIFRKTGERVTLYASSNDRALIASKEVNGYRRAGDSGDDIVVIPEVDTVDVSSVDTSLFGLGHSYYGDNCSVLSDIVLLLRGRQPPPQRGLERKEKGGLAYWVVHAASGCPR